MHIGINAQLLSYGQSYRNGGVSRYIRYLLTQIAKEPGDHTYTVFVNGQDVIEQLEQHPQITFVSAPWPESKPAVRIAWEQFTLPRLVRQRQIDVLHSPVNVRPEYLPARCASIVTIHDLAFLRFPHVLTAPKRLYHQTFTIRSLKRASMLITVSESTKRDVHELVGIPYERIQTIYPCIDERFSNVSIEDRLDTFREKYGVAEGFILYLGTLEPRKNIATLIDAYAQLRQQYHIREKLVLAGGKGWLYDTIFEKVRQSGLEKEVLFPGFVSDSEQALWYQSASVFAYPSLYEGFGIPVAEALASGTPVVTSNISSLPEAGAGLALCIDPNDMHALSGALYQALTDPALRERCRQQASTVAQRFSAQTMAAKTIAAYEQAAKIHQSQRITFVQ
ncbi:glycosyltransferase family 4 protein [Dictyobacter kobayashii]|uniref:Glycosyl transferase family 1 n=1 Tax=Dictyobacter kobayashii TaxID=2014872 RepID=A0A402AEF9_9CHLR|nr:glycosyltransferase family 1 protein [Dictyobacter kobayashii]GCE17475.1 glycosyl transferase family 1 [Dictyobacter kobayashii]